MTPPRQKKLRLRPTLRAFHRDIGYFAVGLTFVYALSGLAVNHIDDRDPSYTQVEREYTLTLPLPTEDEALAKAVLKQLEMSEPVSDVYRASADQVEISVGKSTLHVEPSTGKVFEEGQQPRFLLRAANWLHLNRGKRAWTYVADAYAVFLLFLATSGLLMIPGRKGLLGRGAVIASVGALIPILYVVFAAP